MRVSRLLLTVCAAGVCAGFISVRADDTPAQAAARAALEQKLSELGAQQQPRTNDLLVESNTVVVVVPPHPAPATAAPTSPAPAVQAPSATASVGTAMMTTASPAAFAPDNAAQAAARAALAQAMTGSNQGEPAAQPVPSQTQPARFTPPPGSSAASYAGTQPGFQPIVAPPLPISADKQAQLRALNASYIADQIPPEVYFKQRAQILAAP
jgi:hypothetical protein